MERKMLFKQLFLEKIVRQQKYTKWYWFLKQKSKQQKKKNQWERIVVKIVIK